MFLSDKTPVIGIDIGTSSVKLIKVRKKKSGYILENFGMMPLPPEAIVDNMIQEPELVVHAIKNLVKSEKVKVKQVAIGISGESVVIKKITMPKMTKEELDASIELEAEQYIPFDISDVRIDYQILKEIKNIQGEGEEFETQIEVLLVAAKKDIIEERTNIIYEAGLTPVVVDIDAFAIENAFQLSHKEKIDEGVWALIDIGAGMTNVNILEGGVSAFTKDIPIGGIYFTQAIQNELNTSFEIAENLKCGIETEGYSTQQVIPIILSSMETVALEINKAFEFYSTAANKDIDSVAISGGCTTINGVDEVLEKKLKIPIMVNDPFESITINNKIFDLEYIDSMKHFSAVGVGLALRRFYDR